MAKTNHIELKDKLKPIIYFKFPLSYTQLSPPKTVFNK